MRFAARQPSEPEVGAEEIFKAAELTAAEQAPAAAQAISGDSLEGRDVGV